MQPIMITFGFLESISIILFPITKNKQANYWTSDDIRVEMISIFLEQHGPHLEFDSTSFNYSMPKEGISGVTGERKSM